MNSANFESSQVVVAIRKATLALIEQKRLIKKKARSEAGLGSHVLRAVSLG